MKESITVTSKGQTTLPVQVRRQLGLDKKGGVLQIQFNESRGELIISKAPSLNELSNKISSYIKPGTTPLTDVGEYYQQHREKV